MQEARSCTRREVLISGGVGQTDQGGPDKEAVVGVCSGGRGRGRRGERERLNHNESPGPSLDSSPLEALREFRGRV